MHTLFNPRLVARIMGILLLIEAAQLTVPALCGWIYGEPDGWVFAIVAACTALCGTLLATQAKPHIWVVGRRDGFLLTAITWAVFSVFGMMPFIFGSTHLSVSDAWFEAMSGFTTTGATVLARPQDASHSILLWRAVMQWVGGLGIILLTLAIIPGGDYGGTVKLFHAEVTGLTHDKIRPRVGQTAKSLWSIYIGLTIAAVLLLWAGPMNFFESLCQGLSTISTGGFSTQSDSVAHWHSWYTELIMALFMFAGGINFALMYKALSGHPGQLWRSDVFRTYVAIVVGSTVVMAISMAMNGSWSKPTDLLIMPIFQAVSMTSSSGFICGNYEIWGMAVVVLMLLLMTFGACAGSTTGGAKIDRLLLVFKRIKNEVYRFIHPNSVRSVRINGRIVAPEAVHRAMAFMAIFMGLVFAGAFVLGCCGLSLGESVFNSLSCVANMGVGIGVTGPEGCWAAIPDGAKWVLSILMLVGRLEIYTVIILFTRYFWHR